MGNIEEFSAFYTVFRSAWVAVACAGPAIQAARDRMSLNVYAARNPIISLKLLSISTFVMNLDAYFPLGMFHYMAGGICIGLAVSLIFLLTGQVAGMSSVFSSTWSWCSRLAFFQQSRWLQSRGWRATLALGLILGTALYWFGFGPAQAWQTSVPGWQLLVGGFIAGFGARMSNGCTSGHGICGMASLQLPSLMAVLTFLSTAFITANLIKALGGY